MGEHVNSVNDIKLGQARTSSSYLDGLTETETGAKGEDVKGAFLALLQSLVGLSGAPVMQVPEIKPVSVEVDIRENIETKKSEASIERNAEDSRGSNKQSVMKDHQQIEASDNSGSVGKCENKEVLKGKVEEVKEIEATKIDAAEDGGPSNDKMVEAQSVTSTVADEVLAPKVENSQVTQVSSELKNNKTNAAPELINQAEVQTDSVPGDKSVVANNEASLNSPQLEQSASEVVVSSSDSNKETEMTSKAKSKVVTVADYSPSRDEDQGIEADMKFILAQSQVQSANLGAKSSSEAQPLAPRDQFQIAKDALLSRLLLGGESFGASSAGAIKQGKSGSDSGLEGLASLAAKSSMEKGQTEKTGASAFTKRSALSQDFIDKVKEVLEKAAAKRENDTISIKVDPPHLGEIKVKVSHKNGEIYTKLTPENKEVEQVLKSQSHELNAILQGLGFKAEEVHVQIGSESVSQFPHAPNLSNENGTNLFQRKGGSKNLHGKNGVAELLGSGVNDSNAVMNESGWVA